MAMAMVAPMSTKDNDSPTRGSNASKGRRKQKHQVSTQCWSSIKWLLLGACVGQFLVHTARIGIYVATGKNSDDENLGDAGILPGLLVSDMLPPNSTLRSTEDVNAGEVKINEVEARSPTINLTASRNTTMTEDAAINSSGESIAKKLVSERPSFSPKPVPSSKYAYVFMLAGCDPDDVSYIGYVYGVLVASQMLQDSGSQADRIALVRMSKETNATVLPPKVESLLTNANVTIRYIEKNKSDNFYTAMMEKFRILNMTEYRRVIYMDADVMPLCNLDYLFHMSDEESDSDMKGTLAPNLVMAGRGAPANGGFFMLAPEPGDYIQLVSIIEAQKKKKVFSTEKGWGHVIQPPDRWKALTGKEIKTRQQEGFLWNFYAAYADQGLLYHWTKYVKQNVSIVNRNEVERWGNGLPSDEGSPSTAATLQLVRVDKGLIAGCSSPNRRWFGSHGNESVYNDLFHFAYAKKPWQKGIQLSTFSGEKKKKKKKRRKIRASERLWLAMLQKVLPQDWHVEEEPMKATLGSRPKETDMFFQNEEKGNQDVSAEG